MSDNTPFSKISSSYQRLRASSRFSVVLGCLLVAVVFWFLITLSKVYSGQIVFPVKYINVPHSKMVISDLPRNIEVTVKSTGFEMLAHYFRKNEDSLVFDVETRIPGAKETNRDMLVIPSSMLAGDLTERLGSDYTIGSFYPDSIVFNFAGTGRKTVPVRLDAKITFEKQFDSTNHPVIVPDNVTISGPDSIISKIQYVETLPLVYADLKSPLKENVKLRMDSFITASPEMVTVNIAVEKFTEGTTEVPVHVINVKPGYTLKTFPDKVIVHYRVPLSRYSTISAAMFDAVADAAELPNSNVKQIRINLMSPDVVRMPVAVPEKVDYVLRKK